MELRGGDLEAGGASFRGTFDPPSSTISVHSPNAFSASGGGRGSLRVAYGAYGEDCSRGGEVKDQQSNGLNISIMVSYVTLSCTQFTKYLSHYNDCIQW